MPRPSKTPVEVFKVSKLTESLKRYFVYIIFHYMNDVLYLLYSFSIHGRLLSKSEINPVTSGLPTMRIVFGDDIKTVMGIAFREVVDKLYLKLQVISI